MPVYSFGKKTNIAKILVAMKARIVAAASVNANYVYVSSDKKDLMGKVGTNTKSVRIVPPLMSEISLIQGFFLGGGNNTAAYSTNIKIDVMSRLAVDQSYRDDTKIIDETLGLSKFASQIRFALSDHVLVENAMDTQSILLTPIRLNTTGFNLAAKKTYETVRYIAQISWNDEVQS